MSAYDSQVFSTALHFCRQKDEITPEDVIYGFSKLLLMDESQVDNLISDENKGDLDEAHMWFSNNKLDLNLIKSGLLLLTPYILLDEERKKHVAEFRKYLDKSGNVTSSMILDEALSKSFVDFKKLFCEGKGISDIFTFSSELKEKFVPSKEGSGVFDDGEKEASSGKDNEKASEVKKEAQKKDKTSEGRKPAVETADIKKQDIKKPEEENNEIITIGEDLPDFKAISERNKALTSALLDVVKGQDRAVLKFVKGFSEGELLKNTEKGKHPRSYFFFFGPSGTGKTLLAETAAKAIGRPSHIFNMSEFHKPDELVGPLLKSVKQNGECILIFDEIEKTTVEVIRMFLQILGSGSYQYSGTEISFQDAIIIFTSNAGAELYEDRTTDLTSLPEKVLIDALKGAEDAYGRVLFTPEICSRIATGNTILFNHLSIRHLAEMVRNNFDIIVEGLENEYGVKVTYSRYLPLLFLYNRGGDIDARVATGQSGKFLKNEIFELLRQLQNSNDFDKIEKINIDIDWSNIPPELVRLFKMDEKEEILFFTEDGSDISEAVSSDRFNIITASSLDEARNLANQDVAAVYIDPFFGKGETEAVLSIDDYNTDGIRLFHELVETHSNLPIYLLETGQNFSDVDRDTFIQAGAAGTSRLKKEQVKSFARQFEQTLEELYMERENALFSQRGFVIDFNTKQKLNGKTVSILFYNLKKRMAVGLDSRAAILSEAEKPKDRFDDVIGASNAKEELKYFVNYLKNPKKFMRSGAKAPKGVLLYGPPGTGKTMLARAMAGESDVMFFETSAAEFKSRFVGESEANVRRLFAQARKFAPAIIFIDEIDAIGKKRTGSESAHHDETLLNMLLTEMDGFNGTDPNKPVFVLAATNYGVGEQSDGVALLDEALLRRFDNKIYVDLPKESERYEYIKRELKKRNITGVSDETAHSIAERTTGQSLAILQNVVEFAFRKANKENRETTDDDLLTALEEYNYGEKKEWPPEYYRSVAIHETGHAYVSYISGDKPSYITIESRGNFGGYMQHENSEDVPNYSKEDLLGKIRVSLAGRAAEQVFFGKDKSVNTGASSDLKHATDIAFGIICSYGMDDGLIVLGKDEVLRSGLAGIYVEKVNEILQTEMQNTIDIIENAKDKIQMIADVLAKENKLTGEQFKKLMEEGTL